MPRKRKNSGSFGERMKKTIDGMNFKPTRQYWRLKELEGLKHEMTFLLNQENRQHMHNAQNYEAIEGFIERFWKKAKEPIERRRG